MPARITAAPVPIKFTDGTVYQFSPLSDKDLDELDEWLSARVVNIARQSLPPDATQEDRDETLTLAMREASKVSFLSANGQAMLGTIPGLLHLLYLSVRKLHPDVKELDMKHHLLADAENIYILQDTFAKVNIVKPTDKEIQEGDNNSKNHQRARVKK